MREIYNKPFWIALISTSKWAELSMQICGGYFVSDAIVVLINRNYYPQIADFILHHIVSITAFMLVDKNQGKQRITALIVRKNWKLADFTLFRLKFTNHFVFSVLFYYISLPPSVNLLTPRRRRNRGS